MPIDRTSHLIAPVPSDSTKKRSFYRSFIQFLFSNLGLVIVVVAYSIGGAFLFTLLEQYIELQNCQQGSLSENISISNISETIYNYVALGGDNTTTMYTKVVEYFENFTTDIYGRRNTLRYTGQDCSNSSLWNFPSALLFTITIITTIGYGHVTPTSWEGQITCICYALIGIPIFLLCLASISSVLGDIFRFMYSGLLHCFCCACRAYTRKRRRQKRRMRAGKVKSPNDLDYTGSATIDPSWPEADHHGERKLSDDEDEDDENDQGDIWDRMESRVPFGAVILIIIGYICLGAFIFNKFEQWTMIESVYFCYVTLSTMGFGDYVPGITSASSSGYLFVLTCLYILFGLAILAMCFDLIKEGIVDKFHWFAQKLGIIADDEDQVDEDRTRYANFQYESANQQQQQQRPQTSENSVKRPVVATKSIDSFGEPPAYEYESPDSKWLKNVRDKSDPSVDLGTKKMVKIKDEKH